MSQISRNEALAIDASLYNQKLDVTLGTLDPAEFVRRCRAAREQGVTLRDNVVRFAQSIDPAFEA